MNTWTGRRSTIICWLRRLKVLPRSENASNRFRERLVRLQHKPLNLAPPWGSSPAWREANRSIDIHIHAYRAELGPAVAIAREVRSRLASIFPFLNDLCMATCRCCPEPCCLTASPWYDFRDLLFLHLSLLEIPRSQPVHDYKDTCCYLSPRGCTLSRITRPWICTWYLCPTQAANMKRRNRRQWETINRTVSEFKRGREQLEVEYIRVIS